MSWRLFLDDDCDGARAPRITVENPRWRALMNLPPSIPDTGHLGPWVLARTADEAIGIVGTRGMPAFVSFDHDLGDGKDAPHVVKWMIERALDGGCFPGDFAYEVHSGNPVGRANIRGLLDGFLAFAGTAGARGQTPS